MHIKKEPLVLVEYKSLYKAEVDRPSRDENGDIAMPEKIFERIEQFYFTNADVQQFFVPARRHGRLALQAQNFVGVLQTTDGTTIEILPKIASLDNENEAKDILLKMLRTLKDSPFKNISMANLKTSKLPLLEIFIAMFLEALAVLIRRGIKNDYIAKEENLGFLKGKLKMGEHIRQNYVHKERFYVGYEEYLSDRVENRLIKTALHYLYKKSKSSTNQQRIREFLFVFDDIGISHNVKTDFEKVQTNRQMRDYEQVLLWCRTFLLGNSFSPYKGDDIAFALLFDMNLLFESYVGHHFKKQGFDVKLQDKTHHLAYLHGRGKFRLKPDIVIDGGRIVADTKWKLLSEKKNHQGVAQADMYQLFAYGKKYDNDKTQCEKLFLIYPKYENDFSLQENLYYFDQQKEPSEQQEQCLQIIFYDLINDHINICFIEMK